jgi:hypothetical protein
MNLSGDDKNIKFENNKGDSDDESGPPNIVIFALFMVACCGIGYLQSNRKLNAEGGEKEDKKTVQNENQEQEEGPKESHEAISCSSRHCYQRERSLKHGSLIKKIFISFYVRN